MQKGKIKVVVDTNWWISFVISRFKGQLAEVLINPRVEFYSSDELNEEIQSTLESPSLKKFILPKFKDEFVEIYPSIVLKVVVTSTVTICRDAKDNFLLSLSKDSKADYLVSGDKDLLVIGQFGKTKILKMSDFLVAIKTQ